MNHRTINILAAMGLMLLFGVFVAAYEQYAFREAQARIETHARIITDAVWNYNHQGVSEYLALAAETDNYASLTITQHHGGIFKEVTPPAPARLEGLLLRLHLIPRVPLMAHVEYQGNLIGWVEAVWLPHSIYVYAYVFSPPY